MNLGRGAGFGWTCCGDLAPPEDPARRRPPWTSRTSGSLTAIGQRKRGEGRRRSSPMVFRRCRRRRRRSGGARRLEADDIDCRLPGTPEHHEVREQRGGGDLRGGRPVGAPAASSSPTSCRRCTVRKKRKKKKQKKNKRVCGPCIVHIWSVNSCHVDLRCGPD
jgi:hypothetical protein